MPPSLSCPMGRPNHVANPRLLDTVNKIVVAFIREQNLKVPQLDGSHIVSSMAR